MIRALRNFYFIHIINTQGTIDYNYNELLTNQEYEYVNMMIDEDFVNFIHNLYDPKEFNNRCSKENYENKIKHKYQHILKVKDQIDYITNETLNIEMNILENNKKSEKNIKYIPGLFKLVKGVRDIEKAMSYEPNPRILFDNELKKKKTLRPAQIEKV